MYIEYIIIFIALGVIIALLIPMLIMLIMLYKDKDLNTPVYNRNTPAKEKEQKNIKSENAPKSNKVVFCRHCATQFDASQKICPQCGTQR